MGSLKYYLVIAIVAVIGVGLWNRYLADKTGWTA